MPKKPHYFVCINHPFSHFAIINIFFIVCSTISDGHEHSWLSFLLITSHLRLVRYKYLLQ